MTHLIVWSIWQHFPPDSQTPLAKTFTLFKLVFSLKSLLQGEKIPEQTSTRSQCISTCLKNGKRKLKGKLIWNVFFTEPNPHDNIFHSFFIPKAVDKSETILTGQYIVEWVTLMWPLQKRPRISSHYQFLFSLNKTLILHFLHSLLTCCI